MVILSLNRPISLAGGTCEYEGYGTCRQCRWCAGSWEEPKHAMHADWTSADTVTDIKTVHISHVRTIHTYIHTYIHIHIHIHTYIHTYLSLQKAAHASSDQRSRICRTTTTPCCYYFYAFKISKSPMAFLQQQTHAVGKCPDQESPAWRREAAWMNHHHEVRQQVK